MDCPDLDMLISFARVPGRMNATAEHVSQCARCSDEVGMLRALLDVPTVLEPIPERLINRVLEALPEESPVVWRSPASPDFMPGHSTLTFVMAVGTALLLIVGMGGAGRLDSLQTVGVVVVGGLAAALIEARLLKLSA